MKEGIIITALPGVGWWRYCSYFSRPWRGRDYNYLSRGGGGGGGRLTTLAEVGGIAAVVLWVIITLAGVGRDYNCFSRGGEGLLLP